jgi:hypothetical protein
MAFPSPVKYFGEVAMVFDTVTSASSRNWRYNYDGFNETKYLNVEICEHDGVASRPGAAYGAQSD